MRSLFFILASVHCFAMAQSNLKATPTLKKVEALFAAGKCDQVIELGSKLLASDDIDDVNALAQTEAILARCHFQLNEIKKAEDQLRSILFLKPTFELSAFETPPPLLEIFDKLKKELAQKSRELQQVKKEADQKIDVIETTKVVRKMSSLAPLLPFGAAQFEYGAKVKGILIASLEGLCLAGNIASYWTKRSLSESQGDFGAYNVAQIFQFVSLGLFAAIYAYSFTDAFLHRNDIIDESAKVESMRVSKEEFLRKLDSLNRKGL